jgi:adenine deaminase
MDAPSPPVASDIRERLIDVAVRRTPADLVVRDCRVLDVITGTMFEGGIAVVGDRIAYVGEIEDLVGPDTTLLEGKRRIATPGLIDGHIHTYESHLPVSELARGMFRRGVTTIITDFYGEAVVRGVEAVKASLKEAASSPLNAVFVLPMPALYQDDPFVHTKTIDLARMEEMASWPECHGLNECFTKSLVGGEPMMRRLVDVVQAKGGKVCGHGSEVSEREVQAWGGWVRRLDDHEAVSGEEALEKLRAGIHIIAREGSGVYDVANIVRTLLEKKADLRRVSFCTDLISPLDLLRRGSIDHCVRLCIGLGVPPVTAVQMATLNSAETHQLDHEVGCLAPGRRADIVLLAGELETFTPDLVIAAGKPVAEGGRNLDERQPPKRPDFAHNTVRPGPITPEKFAVVGPQGADNVLARVIGVADGTIITKQLQRRLPVRHGVIQPASEQGVNEIAAIERHSGLGAIGLGFVEGFGLQRGAMASTYNPHCQHMLVVGASREDMAVAATRSAANGGGFVVVDDGKVVAEAPMPLYGILSEASIDELVAQIEAAIAALKRLGCTLEAPFHTLAFAGLPVSIGTLKISSAGLIDVWRGEAVPIVLS